jgi:hypothetical protein
VVQSPRLAEGLIDTLISDNLFPPKVATEPIGLCPYRQATFPDEIGDLS